MADSPRPSASKIRAALKESLPVPCSCGECPTDEQVNRLLAMDDETLMATIEEAGGC